MTTPSYTSIPNIPTLSPVNIYAEDQRPLIEQINDIYTDISYVVNNKKRRDTYLQVEDISNDLWVDNKAIFRKTIATGILAAGATNSIAHGIVTLDRLIDIRVMVTNGTNQRTLPYANPTASSSAAVDVDITNVVITTGATFGANYQGFIIMEYTKV